MTRAPEMLVTGDAVVLDVQIAQLPVRAVGALIDVCVVGIGYLAGVLLWAMTIRQFDDALTAAILILFTVGVVVGYPLIMETATRGRSLGKMAMGCAWCPRTAAPNASARPCSAPRPGSSRSGRSPAVRAVIASMISAKGKRVGDVFAGTVVITERGPKPVTPPMMPPQLAWWASSLSCPAWGRTT